jgi:hypothetical protein
MRDRSIQREDVCVYRVLCFSTRTPTEPLFSLSLSLSTFEQTTTVGDILSFCWYAYCPVELHKSNLYLNEFFMGGTSKKSKARRREG